MTKNQKIILVVALLIAAALLFFRLTRHDMLSDDAHYAFRSIGYFDYMASEEQTTPVQWFGHRPIWSYLSFHDHPPLVFLIQYIFFQFFGVSILVARLPAALAALGSVVVLFLWGKRNFGTEAGLFAATALGLNSYFIWTGRIGLLESVFIFFLLLGFLYFDKAFEQDKYFLWSGLFFGLAFLSKYTFLFVLPAILIFIIWRHRDAFSNKKFWLGIAVFALVISPVLVYNGAMFASRGHFDVQFADLFGQDGSDWPKLGDRVSGFSANPLPALEILVDGYSWIYSLILLGAVGFALYELYSGRGRGTELFILSFISMLVLFTIIGPAPRWMGVISPFAAAIIGFALSRIPAKKIFQALGVAIAAFLLFYSVNTNTLLNTRGSTSWYADFRVENLGYNQLDSEVQNLLSGKKSGELIEEQIRTWWYRGLDRDALSFFGVVPGQEKFNTLVIYDSNTSWFPTIWSFEKWKFYQGILIMTTEEYFRTIRDDNALAKLNEFELDDLYFIGAGQAVANYSSVEFPESALITQNFQKEQLEPKVVYDDKGREAFYIYYRSFE